MLMTSWLTERTLAQAGEASWSNPLNLSQSGNATDPHIVVDAFNRVHVLWRDDYAGLVYAQRDQTEWKPPKIVSLPFADYLDTLVLVADTQGIIHAAWIAPGFDQDQPNTLYYSNVPGDKFASPAAWITPQLVAISIADFALAASPDGRVHLAFSRTTSSPDFPAGIYTRFVYPSNDIWSLPRMVFTSPYFRGLNAGQSQLSLATDNEGRVYLAWDVFPLEKIYLAISADSGSIWTDAQEIDGRQPSDGGSNGPSQPTMIAGANGVAVTWLAGHQGANCAHYYRQTNDHGQTWSEAIAFPKPFDQTCAQRVQVLQTKNQNGWLALTASSGVYLIAWQPDATSGSQLSIPVLQPALSSLINPETFRKINLACRSLALSQERLIAVACEAERNGDIWELEREMSDPASWFPTATPLPIWSTPIALATSTDEIHSPAITSDSQGRLHTFWTQNGQPSIYYALWDGERWTPTIALLNSPGGSPQSITATFHPTTQELYVAWSDPASASLYYSRAAALQSFNGEEWDVPQPIPLAGLYASEAQLAIGPDQAVYLACVVPYNEGRGVYLIRGLESTDPTFQGLIWSAPEVVFDAAAAGWSSLGDPHLVFHKEGRLSILWTRKGIPPTTTPQGLVYSSATGLAPKDSEELTTGWSATQDVVRGEILWSELIYSASSGGSLHRAWQQMSVGQPVLFHQYSLDEGTSWSEPARITGLENSRGPAGMTVAADGSINLVQAIPQQSPGYPGNTTGFNALEPEAAWAIQRWVWQPTSGWIMAESQPIPGLLSATAVALASGSRGGLGAWMNGNEALTANLTPEPPASNITRQARQGLFYMGRPLPAKGAGTPSPQLTAVEPGTSAQEGNLATPLADGSTNTLEEGETTLPSPTPTINLVEERPGFIEDILGGTMSALAVSLLPVLILVSLVFIFSARRFYRKN